MSDPLYRRELLRLAADAHGAGRLSAPQAQGEAFNPTCGDRIIVTLTLDDHGHITALGHETRACVLAQASASILGQAACHLGRTDIQVLRNAVTAMLKGEAPPPGTPVEAYAAFDGALDYAPRHRCVLLPIEALLKALDSDGADPDPEAA
jgi:NifU-like protein involved in Fe-S cluster formation